MNEDEAGDEVYELYNGSDVDMDEGPSGLAVLYEAGEEDGEPVRKIEMSTLRHGVEQLVDRIAELEEEAAKWKTTSTVLMIRRRATGQRAANILKHYILDMLMRHFYKRWEERVFQRVCTPLPYTRDWSGGPVHPATLTSATQTPPPRTGSWCGGTDPTPTRSRATSTEVTLKPTAENASQTVKPMTASRRTGNTVTMVPAACQAATKVGSKGCSASIVQPTTEQAIQTDRSQPPVLYISERTYTVCQVDNRPKAVPASLGVGEAVQTDPNHRSVSTTSHVCQTRYLREVACTPTPPDTPPPRAASAVPMPTSPNAFSPRLYTPQPRSHQWWETQQPHPPPRGPHMSSVLRDLRSQKELLKKKLSRFQT